jgi:pyruvate dehydrogenase E2 component (dihydrolipoamide acetyltransferase)
MSAAADRYDRVTAVAEPSAGEVLFETTEAVRTAFDQRVTMTDLLVVVAAAALGDAPALNGTYAESTHHVRADCHVALVGAADGRTVTGVIPDAADRSLGEVVEARGSIDGEDDGPRATFTLANAAETTDDGRLVNPPAVAALEVDPTGQRSVPDGDGVDLQPLVTAALTYDTRAVGRRDAEAFLERFFERVEGAPELVLGSYRGRE